jgi:hypothetical protein
VTLDPAFWRTKENEALTSLDSNHFGACALICMRFSALAAALVFSLGLCALPAQAEDLAAQLSAWRARVERSRQEYESFAAEARSRLIRPRRPAVVQAGAPAHDYLSDETLRSGDVIVTDGGLVVFTGEPRLGHDPKDFKRLKQWRGDLRYGARLMEIERANAGAPR